MPTNKGTTTVVCIHGMHCQGAHWDDWRIRLESNGLRVLTPTLRHHGTSKTVVQPPKELGSIRLHDYVNDLSKFITDDELKQQQHGNNNIVLLGHSMGGLIALKLLERGIGNRAVLLAPAKAANINAKPTFAQLITFLGHNIPLLFRLPVRMMKIFANYGFFNKFPEEGNNKSQRQRAESLLGWESGLVMIDMIDSIICRLVTWTRSSGFVDREKIKGKPIIVYGAEHDRACPPNTVVKPTAEYYNLEYKELKGRGHWIIAEPGWEKLADEIYDWIISQKEISNSTAVDTSTLSDSHTKLKAY